MSPRVGTQERADGAPTCDEARASGKARSRRGRERSHGWPLHVIEDRGIDPNVEQPASFVAALLAELDGR